MSAHAELSPSSASRWMACPGSVRLNRGLPDTSSSFADEGTDAHELAAMCLTQGLPASAFEGQTMGRGNVVNTEMVLAVQDYLDYVRNLVAVTGGELLVEQRLPIDHLTGEDDAHGTSDVVILAEPLLIDVDLKYGRGVPVEADNNPQLQIYSHAAMREFSALGDFTTVQMVIHQPRLGAVSEWTQSAGDLEAFALEVKQAAIAAADPDAPLVPGDKQCKFCKARATCPALAAHVQEIVGMEFDELATGETAAITVLPRVADDSLSMRMQSVDLIETWCKAVRAEVETRLLAGQPVEGYKLVQGKKGDRAWSSKEEAEAMLKGMRIPHDQMYDYSVISPTSADKLAKAEVIGPRQWPKLQALITQSGGKPSVAPESDKRPALAIAAVVDDFTDVSGDALV